MRQIADASAARLIPFVQGSVDSGSVIHKDASLGYEPLGKNGYHHTDTVLRAQKTFLSELMPWVHRIESLLKRWLLGIHQGAVSHNHLDEFIF